MNETRVDLVGLAEQFRHTGKLWYIANPYETSFRSVHEVPDYHRQVWFSFFLLIALEHVILLAKKESSFRLNDQVTSITHWIFQESMRVFFRGAEYYAYIAIHERCHLWVLPWNSLWTWGITAIAVDFCYYWLHRSNHEVHFLWAQHQVHHSSEEFNLSVGLRQSVLQHWCNFLFYLPLAFFIPPSHFVTHYQFNLIYQLWIHTKVIGDLGTLEFFFNTPKHHRVHHGCNLYCLDKNYGGVLIVWDRLFGTFMEERPKEDIIYGLVVSPRSFNPLYLQLFYSKQMVKKCLSMSTLGDKLSVLWKGPSWFPGSPRLGLDEYKVNVTSRTKYDTCVPTWQSAYIILHFFMAFYNHVRLYDDNYKTSGGNVSAGVIIISNILTLTSVGFLFDKYKYSSVIELLRCLIYLTYWSKRFTAFDAFMYYAHLVSCGIWTLHVLQMIRRYSRSR